MGTKRAPTHITVRQLATGLLWYCNQCAQFCKEHGTCFNIAWHCGCKNDTTSTQCPYTVLLAPTNPIIVIKRNRKQPHDENPSAGGG